MVPTPEKNRAVEVGNPMITGTMNVAPNMATTCCSPMPIVIGADSRSSGATTVPGSMLRPSPCSFQVNMSLIVTMVPSSDRAQHGLCIQVVGRGRRPRPTRLPALVAGSAVSPRTPPPVRW